MVKDSTGKIKITLEDGTVLELDKGDRVAKAILNKLDDVEEERLSEFVPTASNELIKLVKEAFVLLSDEQRDALKNRTFIARFNGRSVIESGMHQSTMVQLRQRKPRTNSKSDEVVSEVVSE
jgi:hypothetical protein